MNLNRNAVKLLIQKGWPFALPVFLFGLPPVASKGYALQNWGNVNAYILMHSILHDFQPLYPIFKAIPAALAFSLLLFGNKPAKLLALFAAVSYTLFGILQGISLGEEFGLGIHLSHLALSLLIAVAWLRETLSPRNDYTWRERPLWKYWVILPALLAFWEPANPMTGTPDFNPVYLLSSAAGLVFCMMTPFYLAVLILCHPKVNSAILTMTSVIGLLYALGNLWMGFFLQSGRYWWIGVLHLPLLVLAVNGLILSAGDFFTREEFLKSKRAKKIAHGTGAAGA
jgi:hypothetical protein